MTDPIDTLPADHPFPRLDNAATTVTPWIAALGGSSPIHHWYALPNSAPPRAIASPRGRRHPVLLLCSAEPTAYEYSDVDAAIEEARHSSSPSMPRPFLQCPFNYARLHSRRSEER